ncbi:MAG: hypothetical protein ACRDGV_07125 [Candidatus Limnocylindria bacterium]
MRFDGVAVERVDLGHLRRATGSGAGLPLTKWRTDMVSTFASGTLVVLGVLFAVLGLLLAGSLEVSGIGLLAILAGGMLAMIQERRETRFGPN